MVCLLLLLSLGAYCQGKRRIQTSGGKVLQRISSQSVDDKSQIANILALSYEDLPYHLKPYFLYLGVFPEDHEIRAKKLIRLWVAEGFVEPTGDETVEEAAEDCLEELIHRSLIQVVKRDCIGRVKRCRIHDLLLELSISKAKEDKFLDVHRGDTNPLSPSKARRLSIHHATSRYTSLNHANQYIRSLSCFAFEDAWLGKKQEKFIYRGFNLLRVLHLDVSSTSLRKFPNEICTLIHLRYLGFRVNRFTRSLPSSLSNLCSLETLHVEAGGIYIPSCIWNMQQLRHVDVASGIIKSNGFRSKRIVRRPSLGLDCLLNLQTLKDVVAGDWTEDCLGKLTNLKKLRIWVYSWSRHGNGLSSSLPKLDRLQSLRLRWGETIPVFMPFQHHLHMKKMNLDGKLEKLPEWYEFSPTLTKLSLLLSKLMEDPMATLEKLPNLRILILRYNSYNGKEMVCSAQGFPQLESLCVNQLDELEEWIIEEGAMPKLLHLLIHRCSHLKMLPEGLQHVAALQKLVVCYMPNEFKDRMQENGGEDWHKIKHIPSIEIE